MSKEPIAVEMHYKIRDNQFWYNDCSFRNLIEDKYSIDVDIEGLGGTQTFYHSNLGHDNRITLSYTIPSDIQEWWGLHRGEVVKVELVGIKSK